MGKSKKRIESYLIDKENAIGKGAFGEVYLCEHEITKSEYVAKIVNKPKLDSDEYMKKALNQEINIQNSLKHQNIVQFVDVFETSNNIYIIQQYCKSGTLRNLINTHGKLSQADALHCLKCLCLGFTEIAKKGIMHRDLKPQNILINENELKIADFGFAKKMINHRQLTGTTLGTPFYMAPQLLKSEKYSSKCDVWSIGVIFYELLFGTHPWKGNNISQLLSNVENDGLYFDPQVELQPEIQIFLIETLQKEQGQRLSWLQVFEHKIWTLLSHNQFQQIAVDWRNSYIRSAEKLNELAEKVTLEQLIAAFLQLEVSALDFGVFSKVILWLFNKQQDEDVGIMYELFDKDCNGVIDFQEFVTAFGYIDGYAESTQIIHKMLEKGHFYHEHKDWETFEKLGWQMGFQKHHIKEAFIFINNIKL